MAITAAAEKSRAAAEGTHLRTPAPSREDLESQAVADVAMRACMAAVLELTAGGY
jgi:hypothetical protein